MGRLSSTSRTADAPLRAVLVTGASSGIGRATALRFARNDWIVFAGVRKDTDATSLASEGGPNVRPLMLDVTSEDSIANARATFEASDIPLIALINNAGSSLAGPLEALPLDHIRSLFELNFYAQLAMVAAFAPSLRATHGTVVNVSSIQGRFAAPFLGPYAASKHALEAASDALRVELAPFGIRVVVVEPGAVKTSIWKAGAERSDELAASLEPEKIALYQDGMNATRALAGRLIAQAIDPDRVARVIERAASIKRPRARYLVGNDSRLRLLLARLPDGARDRFFLGAIDRIKRTSPSV